MCRFIAVCVDRMTEYDYEPMLTEISTLYSELVGVLCSNGALSGINDEQIAWLKAVTRV